MIDDVFEFNFVRFHDFVSYQMQVYFYFLLGIDTVSNCYCNCSRIVDSTVTILSPLLEEET